MTMVCYEREDRERERESRYRVRCLHERIWLQCIVLSIYFFLRSKCLKRRAWKKWQQLCLKSLSENPGTMSLNKQNQHNWNDLNHIHNILLHISFSLSQPLSNIYLTLFVQVCGHKGVRLYNFCFNMICCYDLHTFNITNHKKRERKYLPKQI